MLGRGQALRAGSGPAPQPLPAPGRRSPRRGPLGSASCCSAHTGGRICASLCPGSSPSQLGGRAVSAQRPRPPHSAPAAPQVPGSLGTWVPFTPQEPCGHPHHPLLITLGHCWTRQPGRAFSSNLPLPDTCHTHLPPHTAPDPPGGPYRSWQSPSPTEGSGLKPPDSQWRGQSLWPPRGQGRALAVHIWPPHPKLREHCPLLPLALAPKV